MSPEIKTLPKWLADKKVPMKVSLEQMIIEVPEIPPERWEEDMQPYFRDVEIFRLFINLNQLVINAGLENR